MVGAVDCRTVLASVTDAVVELDQECVTVVNGSERGLVHAGDEFRERSLRATRRKLSHERTIAWYVGEKLAVAGYSVNRELHYPQQRRKSCDLVVTLCDSRELWVELKTAWKAWFSCELGPIISNPSFKSYLWGTNRTHSLRHDFEKLGAVTDQSVAHRAVCLVGFDRVASPMDQDVHDIVQGERDRGREWQVVTELHWQDRRCCDFRINVWAWLLQ
jgi:hypothetical protein